MLDQKVAEYGIVSCPCCGDKIDFTTEQGQQEAMEHMKKDGPHRRHLQRVRMEQLLNQLCGTGLLRRA